MQAQPLRQMTLQILDHFCAHCASGGIHSVSSCITRRTISRSPFSKKALLVVISSAMLRNERSRALMVG